MVDLRNYLPLGPIFHFGLYNIPPQPKKLKQWTITQSIINFFCFLVFLSCKLTFKNNIEDKDGQLTTFIYPVAEPNLAQLSWNEFWSKKQENQSFFNYKKFDLVKLVGGQKAAIILTIEKNCLTVLDDQVF